MKMELREGYPVYDTEENVIGVQLALNLEVE